jgi:hypothetical protein
MEADWNQLVAECEDSASMVVWVVVEMGVDFVRAAKQLRRKHCLRVG